MSELDTTKGEVVENVPANAPSHPDNDLSVSLPEDVHDDSEPVEFDKAELDELDLDSIDVNDVPVLTGDDD